MNIHEHQAKEILRAYGAPVSNGIVLKTKNDIKEKILNLKSRSGQKLPTHTIRFWEKEFKQIQPKKINNRRYYSIDQIEIIKLIKFL